MCVSSTVMTCKTSRGVTTKLTDNIPLHVCYRQLQRFISIKPTFSAYSCPLGITLDNRPFHCCSKIWFFSQTVLINVVEKRNDFFYGQLCVYEVHKCVCCAVCLLFVSSINFNRHCRSSLVCIAE